MGSLGDPFSVSIHAPYAGSDVLWARVLTDLGYVSIHAPYAGSDSQTAVPFPSQMPVSIHAPYAGSDKSILYVLTVHRCFNPRPLCRERLKLVKYNPHYIGFQSTPPMQGATVPCWSFRIKKTPFQSTPPMQGATWTAL